MSSRAIRGPLRYDTYVTVASGNYVVVNESLIAVNKTVGAATAITLPPSQATGNGQVRQVLIMDGKGDANVNNITINPAGGNTINGGASLVLSVNYSYAIVTDLGSGNWTAYVIAGGTPSQLANFRNLIDGGDFTTNPWQRGTSGTGIAATLTYTADRFFMVGGASSSISWTQKADTTLPGFNQSLQMERASANTNTAALNMGQVLESADCIKAQGQNVTLSFWAKAGANYSGGALTVAVNHSTTAGNDTAAHLVAASTNWLAVPTIINTTQAITSTWTRYSFTGTVPAGATQLGLLVTWTPAGTAGTDDSVYFQGVQLEIGAQASVFEHRDIQVELELCQRYCWVVPEPAAGVIVGIGGAVAAANNQVFYMATPVQLRAAPTVTVVAGTFKVAAAAAAAAATGLAAGTTHTPNAISIVSTLTETVGLAASLQGGGGTGSITASADL